MIACPITPAFISPVIEFMLIAEGKSDDQDPPVTVEESVDVPLEQIVVVPDIVPAEGVAVTFTVAVSVFEHPPLFTVYVMIDVPAATPVTAPVEEPIVATAGVAEVQVPPVTVELSVEDPLEQIAVVPEIVPAEGAAVTVTVAVVETLAHPPVPVIV